MFGFERLEVWQKAVEYAGTIYDVIMTFPKEERFGSNKPTTPVISLGIFQHRRGSSRSSRIDFNRFIEIAYGSLLEAV